jgi:colicin import membrane protein
MADVYDRPMFSVRGLGERERGRELDAALKRERERVAREADERKRLLMVEIARLEELRRREDDMRLEALRESAVERARLEAETRARLEVIEREQEHERKMLAIREQSASRRARHLVLAGFALAALCAVTSLGFYFGKVRPEAQRLQAAYDELVTAERNRGEQAIKMLERTEKRRAETQAALDAARLRIEKLEDELGGIRATEPSLRRAR